MMRSMALALWSLIVPGVSHAFVGRRAVAIAWALTGPLLWAPLTSWPWLVALVVLRLACTIDAARCARRMPRPRRDDVAIVIALAITIAGALAIRHFVIGAVRIVGSTMAPTLVDGDHIYVDLLSDSPERGDIIAFADPCEARFLVKRVVALGGETVEVRCGTLLVGGIPVATPGASALEMLGAHRYTTVPGTGTTRDFPLTASAPRCPGADAVGTVEPATTAPVSPCAPQLHYVVPGDGVFVLGDNRDHPDGRDSRDFGAIRRSQIAGIALGIWITDPPNARSLSRVGPLQ